MGEKGKGFLKLGIAAAVLWAVMFLICPAIIKAIPAFTEYAAKADEHDIHTGSLFYNDVDLTSEGEMYIRNSIRFTPHKTTTGE